MTDTAKTTAGSEIEEKTSIAEDLVVTKYKMASEITNRNTFNIIFSFKKKTPYSLNNN